jgi:hypothetical protein
VGEKECKRAESTESEVELGDDVETRSAQTRRTRWERNFRRTASSRSKWPSQGKVILLTADFCPMKIPIQQGPLAAARDS